MALTKLTQTLNKISTLPTTIRGQASTVKAAFDENVNDVKDYINETLTEEIDALNAQNVKLTGDQTIEGVKTFSSSPIVPTPTTNMQPATKKYVDDMGASKSNDLDTHKDSSDHDERYYTETELSATTDSSSGADKIGVTTIPTLSGNTAQAVLESVKERLDDIGETNTNVELSNSHYGADGRTYASIGARVNTIDAELVEVNSELAAIATEKVGVAEFNAKLGSIAGMFTFKGSDTYANISALTGMVENDCWYDITNDKYMAYNGTTWITDVGNINIGDEAITTRKYGNKSIYIGHLSDEMQQILSKIQEVEASWVVGCYTINADVVTFTNNSSRWCIDVSNGADGDTYYITGLGNYATFLYFIITYDINKKPVRTIASDANLVENYRLTLKTGEAGFVVNHTNSTVTTKSVKKVNIRNLDIEFNPKDNAYLDVPSYYDAVVGDTLEIFKKGIVNCLDYNNYYIVFIANYGKNYHRKWVYTPSVSDTDFTLTIRLYDQNRVLLDEATPTIKVHQKATSPASQINELIVGDSLTDGGIWAAEFGRRLTGSNGSPLGDGLVNINFIGSKIKDGIKYEGNSGWEWATYNSSSSPFYNSGTSQIDFNNYATLQGVSSIDYCLVLLGWNSIVYADDGIAVRIILNAKVFVDNLLSSYPNCHVVVSGLEIPSEDGCGFVYGSQAYLNYMVLADRVHRLNKAYEDWTKEAAYASNMTFIQLSGQFDTEYGFAYVNLPVNTRDTATEKIENNGIHPSGTARLQIADAFYRHQVGLLQ